MDLFTIPEFAARVRMSVSWVRTKIFQRELKHRRIGRRIFIDEFTLNELLRDSVVLPRKKK